MLSCSSFPHAVTCDRRCMWDSFGGPESSYRKHLLSQKAQCPCQCCRVGIRGTPGWNGTLHRKGEIVMIIKGVAHSDYLACNLGDFKRRGGAEEILAQKLPPLVPLPGGRVQAGLRVSRSLLRVIHSTHSKHRPE